MAKQPEVALTCSFCGKAQQEVRKLIAGPTVYICDECIKLCNDIIAQEVEREGVASGEASAGSRSEKAVTGPTRLLCCSFCGKNQRDVKRLIAGPTVYICDECIGLCNDIIAEEIDREEHAFVLRAKLPGHVRALIAEILERGIPGVTRIQHVINDHVRQLPAGAIPDRRLAQAWDLAANWRMLRDVIASGTRPESSGSAADGSLETELPEWVNPIAERLAGTLEVLDVLARALEAAGLDEWSHLGPSVEIAGQKLQESRELLQAAPPESPAESR